MNFFETKLNQDEPEHLAIYRAVQDNSAYGIDATGCLVAGSRLVRVYIRGYDCLQDELDHVGADAKIHLPEGGLVPGQLYTPWDSHISTDWETGYSNDWGITLSLYEDEIPGE